MDGRASRIRLIAAFGAGIAAWEALVHASLLVNRTTPTLFGVRLGPRLNLVQSVVPAATSVLLSRYAFGGRPRPPLLFRVVARRVLAGDLDLALTRVLRGADTHYAKLAPKVAMAATPTGRLEVRTSAYLLSLFRSMRDEGIAEARATAVLSHGLFRVMRQVWRVPDAIASLVRVRHPTARRARLQVRLARRFLFRDPDWAMREVSSAGTFGVDVTRCVSRDFFVSEGAARLCDEVMCAQDLLMAKERGVPFTRTSTLARGGERCDFRYG